MSSPLHDGWRRHGGMLELVLCPNPMVVSAVPTLEFQIGVDRFPTFSTTMLANHQLMYLNPKFVKVPI